MRSFVASPSVRFYVSAAENEIIVTPVERYVTRTLIIPDVMATFGWK